LLDAGSVLNHDFLLTRPLLAEKSLYIYTLAPESRSFPHLGVSYVYGDLRDMCFADRYFDWIACLSTLEHVGMDNTMLYTGDETKREHDREAHLQALDELRRVLHPGGVLYLSFPFGRARDYGWFQVFDAAMVDTVVDRFRPVSAQMRYFRYLPHGWANCRREEAHDATYFDIHRSRDYDPDYAAASRAIACLELVR
jgi:SAM-dependent methyltransferase